MINIACNAHYEAEVAPDPESTPAGFFVFLPNPDPKSKICEKPEPESLFNFGSSRSLCGHFLSKDMGKLRLDWWFSPVSSEIS